LSSGSCGGNFLGSGQHAAGSGIPSGMLSRIFVMPSTGSEDQFRADLVGCIIARAGDPAVSPD
jgi:hypothetical protein